MFFIFSRRGKKKFPVKNSPNLFFYFFVGAVTVISNDPPCKNDNDWFTRVYPEKLCLLKYELDSNVYNFEN